MKHGYQSARKSLQLHCHSICYLLVAKCKHENGDVCVKAWLLFSACWHGDSHKVRSTLSHLTERTDFLISIPSQGASTCTRISRVSHTYSSHKGPCSRLSRSCAGENRA